MRDVIGLLAILALLGLLPGKIAHDKGHCFEGHSFVAYWVFGMVRWIVAVPAAIMAKDIRPRCPECAEVIQAEANVCPYC